MFDYYQGLEDIVNLTLEQSDLWSYTSQYMFNMFNVYLSITMITFQQHHIEVRIFTRNFTSASTVRAL